MLGLGTSLIRLPRVVPAFVNAAIQGENGFVFDGSGDFLNVPDNPEFSFAGPNAASGNADDPFSFAVWIKRNAINVNECLMAKSTGGVNNFEYRIFFIGDDIYVDTHDTISSKYNRSIRGGQSTTDWQHWVITHSGDPTDGVTIFLNGGDVGTLSTSQGNTGGDMEDTASPFTIGRQDDTALDFEGKMMEAVLWKSELTAEEAHYLYAGGAAARDPNFDAFPYSSSHTVVAWYQMNSATGNKDVSGVGFASGVNFNSSKQGNIDLDNSNDSPF